MSKDISKGISKRIDKEALDFAVELAEGAGAIALKYFENLDTLAVERKGALDLVSIADREVEAYLLAGVRRRFPQDAFFGEEGVQEVAAQGRTWVVDPIDGTLNFLRGQDAWAVSIGIVEAGEAIAGVIHMPAAGVTLAGAVGHGATRNGKTMKPAATGPAPDGIVGVGINAGASIEEAISLMRYIATDCGMAFRRNGSTAVSLAMLVMGQLDGYMSVDVSSWDIAGGIGLANALGFSHSVDWTRRPLAEKLRLTCATLAVFEQLKGWPGAPR